MSSHLRSELQLAVLQGGQLAAAPYGAANFTSLLGAMRRLDLHWLSVLKVDIEGDDA